MATNNNKSTGNIRAPQGANQNKGISAAIDQAGYRREFNERVFSDAGYIQSSIKGLQEQVKEIEKVLNKSQDLTKAESNRYKTALANMKKLEAQLNQMYKSQDVSTKELFDTLNESVKLRQKSVDDLYKHYMDKEKELDGAGKEFIDKKIDYFAAKTRELKGAAEDINEASDRFNKSQKTIADGVNEFIDSVEKKARNLANMFNLQSMAQNEFLEKANERYDIINKMNAQLGYGTDQSTRAYNNISQAFTDFNNQMGSLYNMDDMKQYLRDSSTYGFNTQKLIEENMNSTIIAQKYLGTSSETLDALYKYTRLNNNNETINKYNKTLIALQKEGNGINKDVLDQMIMQNASVESSLAKAGFNNDQLQNLNEATTEMTAQILGTEGLGKEAAEAFNEYRNQILENFGSTEGWTQNAILTGMYTGDLIKQAKNNPEEFLNTILKAYTDRAGGEGSDEFKALIEGEVGNQVSGSAVQGIRQIQSYGVDNLAKATDELREAASQITSSDTEEYVKENTAISDNQKFINSISTNVENFVGSWDGYNKLATTFFGIAIASNIAQGVSSIVNLVSSIKAAGGIKNLLSSTFSKFLGKGSDVVNAATKTGAEVASFSKGSGIAGGALKALGAGTAVIGGTAAVMTVLTGIYNSVRKGAYSSNLEEAKGNLKGTAFEGDSAMENAKAIGYTDSSENRGFFGNVGAFFANAGQGTWLGLNKVFNGSDFVGNNKKYWDTIVTRGDFAEDDADNLFYAYAFLLDAVNSLKSFSDYGVTEQSLKDYLSKEDPNEVAFTKALAKTMIEEDHWVPSGRDGKKATSIDWSKYENTSADGYHKAGLDKVPKDNYRALLHKNEMVLNEDEAEEYRHNFEALRGLKKNNNVLLLPSNSTRGIGGTIGGVEVGDYNSSYVNGHNGIDLYFSKIGTPVGAAIGGSVITSKDIPADFEDGKSYHGKDTSGKAYSSYGRYVEVRGDDGERYIYAHLNERVAQAGDRVEAGTLLGYSGTTGNSSGPHLHFEVRGKGNSSANHAKYYTNYIRSANGTPSVGTGDTSNISGNSSEGEGNKHITLAAPTTTSRRAIPGIGGNDLTPNKENQINGVDRIVNSVDGVSTKIIRYLDEIRQEQEAQRSLIRAFSTSQNMIDMRS